MKITLESTSAIPLPKRSATIEVNDDGMTLDQVIDELIKPVLVAYGFHPKSVEQYLPDASDTVYELNDEKEEGEEPEFGEKVHALLNPEKKEEGEEVI